VLRIVDVSHHNTMPDWRRAVAQDRVAAIVHKATEGTSYDYVGVFNSRMPAIAGSGAVPGAYHFVSSGDGAAQARYFHSVVRSWLDHPLGFLVQIDHEGADYDPRPPLSTTYAFADEWAQLTGGHPVTHYFPKWFWQTLGGPSLPRHVGPLWASSYLSGSGTFDQLSGRVPASFWNGYAGWSAPSIVQFTDSGVVAGVGGLDLNLFNGDADALAALAGARSRGEDMPFTCVNYQLPPHFAFDANQKVLSRTAIVVFGAPLGGLTGLTRGWLSLSADLSEEANGTLVQSTVRVAIASRTADGHSAWAVTIVTLDGSTARQAVPLPGGTDKVSVGRMDTASGRGVDTPISLTLEMD
jgi:GH25 family lysozyme M1 (1,4-beta-N-acetylmuramidase)